MKYGFITCLKMSFNIRYFGIKSINNLTLFSYNLTLKGSFKYNVPLNLQNPISTRLIRDFFSNPCGLTR